MANLNEVKLIGRITKDLSLKYTPSGVAICDVGLAINEYSGKGEDRKETTLFVDVTVFGRQAENLAEYMGKGKEILVLGRLKLDQWEDKDTGKNRQKLKVIANSIQFLGSKADANAKASEQSAEPSYDDGDDQVPF